MDSSASSLSDTSLESPVSWQTAFWTLVALAINTMAQPSGKVCGLPSRLRTYLRGFPIVCLADSLAILVRLCVTSLYLRISPRRSLQMLLRERFPPNLADEEPDSENGIRAIEKMTWLRWLFFVLGTLPPAIKLMAMGGLPWTKTWGMMFLTSFLIMELLIILSSMIERNGSEDGSGSTPRAEEFSFLRLLGLFETQLVVVAILLQICAFYFVQYKLFNTSGIFSIIFPLQQLGLFGIVLRHFISICSYLSCLIIGFFIGSRQPLYRIGILCAIIIILFAIEFQIDCLFEMCMIAFLVWVHVLGVIALAFLVRKFRLLELICLMQRHDDSDWVAGDYKDLAMAVLYLFACNVLYSILGYAYVYDPRGTYNPTWTGIFG